MVAVSLPVSAAPKAAFGVFTRDIGAWWRPSDLFPFTPRSPGVLSFDPPNIDGKGGLLKEVAGGKAFEIGRIFVWEPGCRLNFGWRLASFSAGQDTQVCVRFEPAGAQTRIFVEHRGWDSIPPQHIARRGFADALFLRRHAEWWQDLLVGLRARVAAVEGGAALIAR